MSFYVTPQDVINFTLLPQVKLMTEGTISQKIQLAQMRIEAYCNQSFFSEEKTLELDGEDSNLLSLKQRIYEIDNVFCDLVDYTSYSKIVNEGFGIRLKKEAILLTNPIPSRTGEYPTPKFPQGIGNIILSGKFGWAEIPKEVVFCMNKLTEAYCLFADSPESAMAESGIYKKQTIGGYSYELKDSKDLLPEQSTGDATVDILLKKYKRDEKRRSIKVGVV